MRRRRALALLAGSLALGGCSTRGELALGFLAPLSGRRTDLGENGRNGALVALETFNAQGGVDGRPLRLVVEDDGMNGERALAGFQRLLDQGIVALVGAYSKPVSDAVGPLAIKAGVPVISPNLALLVDDEHDDVVFRLNRTAQQNAKAYARHLAQAGQRRVVLLAEQSSRAFAQAWTGFFRQALQEQGSELVQVVSYTAGAGTSFDALVQTAGAQPCDGAMLLGPTVDVARLCQQLRRRRPGLPLTAIDRAGNGALLQLGGRAVEDLVLLQAFDPNGQNPAFLAFAKRFQERFGEPAGQGAVLAYDAVAVLHQALQHQARGVGLLETMSTTGPYRGLQQPIAFDPQGGAQREAWFVKVQNGRFATLGVA